MPVAIQNQKPPYVRSFVENSLFEKRVLDEIARFTELPSTLFHRAVANALPPSSSESTALTKPCYKIQVLRPIVEDALFNDDRSVSFSRLNDYGHLLPDITIRSSIVALNNMQNLGRMLVYLASTGRSECVDTIIQSARFAEIHEKYLGRALEVAACKGHANIVQMIMQSARFADIDSSYLGGAFQLAASKGHANIVQMIMQSVCFENINSGHLDCALKRAASEGHANIVQMIMQSNRFADINADYLGDALQSAQKNGHGSIVQLLSPFIPNPET